MRNIRKKIEKYKSVIHIQYKGMYGKYSITPKNEGYNLRAGNIM